MNVSVLPAGSEATGVKPYAVPATTVFAGVPEIVGGAGGVETTMLNAGREAEAAPSLTVIRMLL